MEIYLGIDGGGTRSRAALAASDGSLLGFGLAGPSNYDDVGIEAAARNLRQAVDAAWRQAGLSPRAAAAVFLGMAGVVSEEDRETIRAIAARLNLAPPDRVYVDHDIRILLAGGLVAKPGLALIVGTGSACYGRSASGAECRVGGWGYLLDDVGSGYYLGLEAIKGVTRVVDGRIADPSSLVPTILAAMGIDDPQKILRRLYHERFSRSEIAALAPLVLEVALQGDGLAQAIITAGQSELARLVEVAAQRLCFPVSDTHLVMSGGVVNHSSTYRQSLEDAIRQALPEIQIHDPALPPVLGAVLLAMQTLGGEAASDAIQCLQRTAGEIRF